MTFSRSRITLAVLAATIAFSAPAEARHHRNAQFGPGPGFIDAAAIPAYPTEYQARSHHASGREASRHVDHGTGVYRAADEGARYQRPPVGHDRHRAARAIEGDVAVVGHRSSLCAAITGHLSCGCETASYFGVRNNVYSNGRHDLDLASNWGYLQQSPSPCVNCAAWRDGHVKAIIGGGPGGWRILDFNSGHGLTHEYVTASLQGFRFAIPADLKLAGQATRTYHARRHYAHHRHNRIRYAYR